jgi:hypothetical protein
MNKKHFVFIEDKELSKKEIAQIEKERQKKLKNHSKKIAELNKEKLKKQVEINHVPGRVVISIDLEGKNSHTFANGEKIYIGRQFNNLNRRETEPVNAFILSAENIPQGAQVLIHPNSIHDSNKLFNFNEDFTDVKYYSIPQENCYLWKEEGGEWQPFKNYATALRVFEEYKGALEGIENKKLKNVLYITSGELKGKVVRTLHASDYEIIFMGDNGAEERVIRCRHFEDEFSEREEIVGIDLSLTKKVLDMELMIGLSYSDAKYLVFTL